MPYGVRLYFSALRLFVPCTRCEERNEIGTQTDKTAFRAFSSLSTLEIEEKILNHAFFSEKRSTGK